MFPWFSNFLEEISSLPHSIVFLYIFALMAEEGFLIPPCCSLELCIQMGISFLFSFTFWLLFFTQLFVRPPQTTILPFCISFFGDGLDHCLLYNVMRFPSSLEKLKLSLQERLRSFSKDTLKPRFVVNHLFGTVWLVILISIQV